MPPRKEQAKRKKAASGVARKRSRTTPNLTQNAKSLQKKNAVTMDDIDRAITSYAPDDELLHRECLSVRYTMALWTAECFDSCKDRLQAEECFVREAMRQRLQNAIEEAEINHWKRPAANATGSDNELQQTTDREVHNALDAEFNAQIIERVLFWRWYFLQPAMYRQRCRQLEYNLATNGWYLLTRFSPLTICSFPTRKLAEGTALDVWRQENRNRVLRRLKPPTPVVREKSMFPCVKCKSDNTTYYPMQTRGADEPMTNFVTCHDCETRFRRS